MIAALILTGAPDVYSRQSKQGGRPSMTFVQCDMTGIANEIRVIAKREVIRIFNSAGVDVIWVDAEAGCKIPSMNRCFIVVIASQPPEAWSKPYATGFAPV